MSSRSHCLEFPTDPVRRIPSTDRSYDYVISHQWTIGKNKTNTAYYGDQISKLSFPDLYNPGTLLISRVSPA